MIVSSILYCFTFEHSVLFHVPCAGYHGNNLKSPLLIYGFHQIFFKLGMKLIKSFVHTPGASGLISM